MKNYMDVANSFPLWLSVIPVILGVLAEAAIFSKKAKDAGDLVGLTKKEANQAFKAGATAAIGPSMGVFIVMLGLMASIGGPIAWQRLSIIGAAPTELAAANVAAQAQGTTLGAPDYNLINYAAATWVMALNGSAWLLTSGLLTDKLDKISYKITGGNTKKLGLLSVTAMTGAFGYFASDQIVKGLQPGQTPILGALAGSAIAMVVLDIIAKKFPKIAVFNLGIAMVVGMVCAMVVKYTIGG